jgi:hypothetical protein
MEHQETFEEIATREGLYRCSQHNFNRAESGYNAKWFKRGAIFGFKWQQKQIADDYAIEFAEWCDLKTTQISNGEWCNFDTKAKNALTSKELLELFKKEKGL